MNYPLRSSNFEDRKRAARKRVTITIVVILVVIIILSTSPARSILFYVASPIWKFENSVLNSNLFQYFKFKQSLIDDKTALEQKLFLAGNLIAQNNTLQAENDNLKDLLGRKDTKQKTVLSTILVKPPQTPYDSLIIDIGADYMLKVGDKVMANNNVYIGDVSEVLPNSSKVNLYSTPGRKLSVVFGGDSVTAEAVGVGGGNFNIMIPREIEVKEGDVITIPSITTNVFGIVEKVNFKDTDSFQTVIFKSPINISELSFVEVVVN